LKGGNLKLTGYGGRDERMPMLNQQVNLLEKQDLHVFES
jgi:hypothetical protein